MKAFEQSFERAGVKHYASRNQWAARALDAYRAAGAISLPEWVAGAAPKGATPVPPKAPEGEPAMPPPNGGGAAAAPNRSAGKTLGALVLALIAAALFFLFGDK